MSQDSTNWQPHRSLMLDAGDPLRATTFARCRSRARGGWTPSIARSGPAGVCGPSSHKACRTAARYLGALDTTLARSELLMGIQQMIRHPGAVQLAQLKRGEARMERASGPPTRFASGFGATPLKSPDFAGPFPHRESRTS